MIGMIFVLFVSICAVVSTLFIAFSPSKALLATFSVILTVCFTLLAMAELDLKTLFWISPSYLVLDIATLYFMFSMNLQTKYKGIVPTKEKIYLAGMISVIVFLFITGLWAIWAPS